MTEEKPSAKLADWQRERRNIYTVELWRTRCVVRLSRGWWCATIGNMFVGYFPTLESAQDAITSAADEWL
jgi:hypothetical protein